MDGEDLTADWGVQDAPTDLHLDLARGGLRLLAKGLLGGDVRAEPGMNLLHGRLGLLEAGLGNGSVIDGGLPLAATDDALFGGGFQTVVDTAGGITLGQGLLACGLDDPRLERL